MSVRDALPPVLADVLSAVGQSGPATAGPRAVIEFLRERPALLRRWLLELRAEECEEVAKRSAWHHNGFAKIVLHDSEVPGFRVRLHVWPQTQDLSGRRGDSDAHNHRWPFASTVVGGRGLDVIHFLAVPQGGQSFRRFLVGPEIDGLCDAGTVRLGSSSRYVRPRQDVYECPPTVVHRVEPRGRGQVVTLVVTLPPVEGESSVFRRDGDISDPGSRELTAAEFRALVPEVLTAL